MSIELHKSRVRQIRQGDPNFLLKDGFALVPRAMLHVTPECPLRVREMISLAMDNGWLKPVASVYSTEHLRDILSE